MMQFFKSKEFFIDMSNEQDAVTQYTKQANEKLNKYLESCAVAYGKLKNGSWNFDTNNGKKGNTHQLPVAFYKEIPLEPCLHEPKEMLWSSKMPYRHFECKHCGVELQVTWSEK